MSKVKFKPEVLMLAKKIRPTKLTLKQIADQVGTTPATVSFVLRGITQSSRFLGAICKVLDVEESDCYESSP